MTQLLNTFRLAALFALLIAVFGGIGYLFMGATGLLIGLAFAGLMNFVSYLYSDRIVLTMHRAQPLDKQQYADLHTTVEQLSATAGIPTPDLYLMQTNTPNAFATGRNPENSAVCVTTGLLSHLSDEEVEGVLAHEIGHITNRDTLIQAVAGTFAGAISILAQFAFFTAFDEDMHPAAVIGGALLAPIAATLIQLAISRSREFTADATAAQYTDPLHLANALHHIESAVDQSPLQNAPQGTAHLFIVNPFRGNRMARLFSTHPPTEARVQRLQQLAH